MKTKKLTLYGMFLATALIFSYVEQLIPISVGVPGIKIGLANIVTMFVLYFMGLPGAAVLSLVRILLTGFLFGSVFSIIYSLAGAACSILMMFLLIKMQRFGIIGISVAGGIFHNIGQILVAAILLETKALIYYLPVLIVAGLTAGIVVGILSGILMKRITPLVKAFIE